jgi:hypothetical protein
MNMHEYKAFEAQVESSEALRYVAIIPPPGSPPGSCTGLAFQNGFSYYSRTCKRR